MSEDEEVERQSLTDLQEILKQSRKPRIGLLLIGGYAVAAYTSGYRYTKDIDLIADKPALGRLRGLLKRMGYSIRDTEFGIAGSKRYDHGFIDLHISVGRVYDISTRSSFPVDFTAFKGAKRLHVRGFYSKNSSLKAPVISLETLLILKLIPVGRDKDSVDLISLILDRGKEVDLESVAKAAKASDLDTHLLERVRDFAAKLRMGELDRTWSGMTASRLSHVQRRETLRFLVRLADRLR